MKMKIISCFRIEYKYKSPLQLKLYKLFFNKTHRKIAFRNIAFNSEYVLYETIH